MSVGSLLSEANALGVLFGVSRALHITAVLTALVWMFVPAANAYFREKGAYLVTSVGVVFDPVSA
jgi:hypothetical protein